MSSEIAEQILLARREAWVGLDSPTHLYINPEVHAKLKAHVKWLDKYWGDKENQSKSLDGNLMWGLKVVLVDDLPEPGFKITNERNRDAGV